jgi:hypothetical protein
MCPPPPVLERTRIVLRCGGDSVSFSANKHAEQRSRQKHDMNFAKTHLEVAHCGHLYWTLSVGGIGFHETGPFFRSIMIHLYPYKRIYTGL